MKEHMTGAEAAAATTKAAAEITAATMEYTEAAAEIAAATADLTVSAAEEMAAFYIDCTKRAIKLCTDKRKEAQVHLLQKKD